MPFSLIPSTHLKCHYFKYSSHAYLILVCLICYMCTNDKFLVCVTSMAKKINLNICNDLKHFQQAKRDEPSTVVDYEKIDDDARVSYKMWS